MAIFTHVTVGSNDLETSKKFYDAALGALGLKNLGPLGERGVMWGDSAPEFIVLKPANGQPATHANGGTIGFAAPNRKAVHAFHEAALANGGVCEGPPGPRTFTPTAYAAYVRDPFGNKICTYCFAAE
ncbi:MAG: VOC family protein [Alphaproteobacteria bacterium]|nr:VOC family protein [Alphaproteobacteria bacterium]